MSSEDPDSDNQEDFAQDLIPFLVKVSEHLEWQTAHGTPILGCHIDQGRSEQDRRGTPVFWMQRGHRRWERVPFEPVFWGHSVSVDTPHGADHLEEYLSVEVLVLPWTYGRHQQEDEVLIPNRMDVQDTPTPFEDRTARAMNTPPPPMPTRKPPPLPSSTPPPLD